MTIVNGDEHELRMSAQHGSFYSPIVIEGICVMKQSSRLPATLPLVSN